MMTSRISRRSFGVLAAGSAAALATVRFAGAQDATPAAPASIFSGLADLQAVDVTATDMLIKAKIAGCFGEAWYVFNFTNESATPVSFNLGSVPEGITVGDLTSTKTKAFTGEGGELPDWWTDAVFAGGLTVEPGETRSSVVFLTKGSWAVFNTYSASRQAPATFLVEDVAGLIDTGCMAPLDETATPEATPTIDEQANTAPAGLPVGMDLEVTDTGFVATKSPIVGTLVLGVKNTGTQPYDLIVLKAADAVDSTAAVDLATSWLKGEETGAMVVGGVGALSVNRTAYTEINVEAGSYVAFSSMPDVTGGLQLDKGLILTFTA